jgi:hypothetical protein
MSNDLSAQIRALVDAVEPVSASEAKAFSKREKGDVAGSRFAEPADPPARTDADRRRRGRRQLLTVAASVAILTGVGLAWGLAPSSPKAAGHRNAVRARHRSVILTAAEVHTIIAHSTAASASGTAFVTETSGENGTPQTDNTIDVTFDGSNIDELITVHPEPPGSAPTFTTDDRLVDGQFYIYTPGPNGITEWQHDTNSGDDLASMQFPNPRTLYAALSPGAQFEVIGSTTTGDTTLTKLQALDPSAINANALGSFAGGVLSSFVMTIGQDNVVEQMAFSSTQTLRTCKFTGTLRQLKAELEKNGVSITPGSSLRFSELEKKGVIAIAKSDDGKVEKMITEPAEQTLATCGPSTWTDNVSVAFSNLGAPESITAPQGAIDFQGKG